MREGGEGRGGAVYGSSPPKSPTPHPKTLGRVGPVWRVLEGLATLVPLYSLQVLVATRLGPSPRVVLGWDRGQEHFDRAHFLDIIKLGALHMPAININERSNLGKKGASSFNLFLKCFFLFTDKTQTALTPEKIQGRWGYRAANARKFRGGQMTHVYATI